jgi:hypothetical protein
MPPPDPRFLRQRSAGAPGAFELSAARRTFVSDCGSWIAQPECGVAPRTLRGCVAPRHSAVDLRCQRASPGEFLWWTLPGASS